MIQSHHDNFLM